eukprot:scaffold72812_cov61-Phaeocystis_antarctica.AAC.2
MLGHCRPSRRNTLCDGWGGAARRRCLLPATDEGPERPHEGRTRLHVGRAVDRAPIVDEDRLHRVRAMHVARPPARTHHLEVHDFAQDVHVAHAQNPEVGAAAVGRVEATAGATVQVPHRLAHLSGHATSRLRVLPDRAAEGHEALGQVHPQHVHLGL